MTHLTEEELAQYAFDPEGVPEGEREQLEHHVGACPQCSSNLTFIRSVDAGFRDPDVWEIAERDVPATRAAVRNLAAQVVEENEEAERLLADLLGNPARTAFANLGSRKAYITAGVVRRLLRAAGEAWDREPLSALTFADAAIDVSQRLSGYPAGVIHDLRAHAWKERANALASLGQFDASLDALDHAEREFSRTPSSPAGPAMIAHARALVHYHRGECSRAIPLLHESTGIYESLGDTDRYMRVRHWIANTLFGQGDIRGASAIYEELLAWGEAQNDLTWIARESNTTGRCALEIGDLSAAVQSFHRSIVAFRELGMSAEALRPAWGLGLVILASGRHSEALSRLQETRRDFHDRAMLIDEALVSLDIMDALHALGRDSECARIAAEIIQTFTDAGMLTSALTAFAYLKEAAARRSLDPPVTEHVRRFLSRLEREPALLFCEPDKIL